MGFAVEVLQFEFLQHIRAVHTLRTDHHQALSVQCPELDAVVAVDFSHLNQPPAQLGARLACGVSLRVAPKVLHHGRTEQDFQIAAAFLHPSRHNVRPDL